MEERYMTERITNVPQSAGKRRNLFEKAAPSGAAERRAMKLTIELPDSVVEWLTFKAKQDFRSVEEMAAVIIMKEHRAECSEVNSMICEAVKACMMKAGSEEMERVKEILMKQLELLQEESQKTTGYDKARNLAELSNAMAVIGDVVLSNQAH